jgi:branched-chain amino acid transport system permease protein
VVGAYLAFSLVKAFRRDLSAVSYILISVAADIAVGLCGLVVERLIFRRLQHVDEAYSLIAGYALSLISEGAEGDLGRVVPQRHDSGEPSAARSSWAIS